MRKRRLSGTVEARLKTPQVLDLPEDIGSVNFATRSLKADSGAAAPTRRAPPLGRGRAGLKGP